MFNNFACALLTVSIKLVDTLSASSAAANKGWVSRARSIALGFSALYTFLRCSTVALSATCCASSAAVSPTGWGIAEDLFGHQCAKRGVRHKA
jgi:hypothetical protein